MTLTRLLGIEIRFLQPNEYASLSVAERIWQERGCPTDTLALTDILEIVLTTCRSEGIPYAPILLQRKKRLERGTFAPNVAPRTGASQQGKSGDGGCPQCGGTGYVVRPGGASASLCDCGAWKRKGEKPA